FGLEIKRLDLKLAGQNALIIPHTLTDSFLLPLFSLGVLTTGGHTDLGARVIPSTMVRFTAQVDLNVLSLSGGGQILTKTYLLAATDPAVTERAFDEGLFPSPADGQELGRAEAPVVLGDLFSLMSRDPEMGYLPLYARAAWLRRVTAEDRVSAAVKTRLVEETVGRIEVPEITAHEVQTLTNPLTTLPDGLEAALGRPGLDYLAPYGVHPAWTAETMARARLFALAFNVLIETAGRLAETNHHRPLTPEETALEAAALGALSRWVRTAAGNELAKELISQPGLGGEEKAALVRLLAERPGDRDNGEFLRQEEQRWLEALAEPAGAVTAEDRQAAAALLAALKGEAVLSEPLVPRELLFQVLSGRDFWAASLVRETLEQGYYYPDAVLLAGAMEIGEVLEVFLDRLSRAAAQVKIPPEVQSPPPPEIPLHPAPRIVRTAPELNLVLAARAAGSYPGRPRAAAVLRRVAAAWPTAFAVSEALAAEAVLSLARLDDRAAAGTLIGRFVQLARADEGPLIRQAILAYLEKTAGPAQWERLLRAVEPLAADQAPLPAVVREAADFFGRTRYGPAAGFLLKVINHPSPSPTARQAAFQALGRLATPEAQAALEALAAGPRRDLAPEAEKALEALVLEKALWRGL
ncbi:MAG: hypothetical protein AB1896_01660, partial [Thermodesulfobacteriota bacterium]